MIRIIKKVIRILLPNSVKKRLKAIYFNHQIRRAPLNHRNALIRIRKKEKIKVVFILIHEAAWKCEELYQMMVEDSRFEPIVVICPYIAYGEETMLREMRWAYKTFKNKRYNVVKTLNEKSGEWLNVKKEIQPDIVFFTNPWGLTRADYLIQNYKKILTCYIPYGFKVSHLHEAHYNLAMQNLVWKFFIETEIHKKLSRQYSRNKSVNTLITGYPGMDVFFKKE